MTDDLPTLKIGCGENIGAGYCASVKPEYVVHYCGRTCSCKDIFYCETCKIIRDKVLPVLKAHAAAHHKKGIEYKNMGALVTSPNWRRFVSKAYVEMAARDAVLGLAGLDKKDSEGGGQ